MLPISALDMLPGGSDAWSPSACILYAGPFVTTVSCSNVGAAEESLGIEMGGRASEMSDADSARISLENS